MQDYQKLYAEKLMTPDDAAAQLESNTQIASDIATAQSYRFIRAVCERVRKGELKNMVQHSLLDTQSVPFMTEPEIAAEYRGVTWFSGAFGRKAVNAGLMDVMPAYYRDIPSLFGDYVKPEVFVGVVSPMDKHGYFSTGCDYSVTDGILKAMGIDPKYAKGREKDEGK